VVREDRRIKLGTPHRSGGQAINDLVAGRQDRLLGCRRSSRITRPARYGRAHRRRSRFASLPDADLLGGIGGWCSTSARPVPAGTLPAIVARLNSEINRALSEAAIRESLQSAQELSAAAPRFAQLVRDDFEKYRRLRKI
jgi:tripartite-type tricarboxylate transporter receptor subunit TctC